ncbi:MAG: sulfite exporter TauE/SafE family protein [Desulfobacterales bacterium]|nr:sulfite exporter TauE/SafE family protein [Desulfobacterales bacterium]
MIYIALYLAVGGVAGVLAGLLGIGGGLIIVPMLASVFTHQHVAHEVIVHMALGTSLASILFTSVSSMRSHHKRGAVVWPVVFRITPGILVGTFTGTWIASMLSTNFLKCFFGIFLCYVATQMLMGIKPKPTRDIPGTPGIFAAGSIIGIFSSLVGIGGGTLSVPFLTWCNTKIHKAIGTSAGIGFPIAAAGFLGYVINGLGAPNLPPHSLGFVNLGALAGIVAASVLTAPIGVKLAHSLPVDKLKRVFAVLLYVVGTRMLISVFW